MPEIRHSPHRFEIPQSGIMEVSMKINEVEQQVGITKKNIRFYEQQGLLSPKRNMDNGYRDYAEEDVTELKKIKMLRKLSLPIEEIRRIQKGDLLLSDALQRQVILLERERASLEAVSYTHLRAHET